MLTSNSANLGEFKEREYGKYFTFRLTDDAWANKHKLTHEIDVLDGPRYGIVKKTVAYVAVDEQDDGTPVLEKWSLVKFHFFNKDNTVVSH